MSIIRGHHRNLWGSGVSVCTPCEHEQTTHIPCNMHPTGKQEGKIASRDIAMRSITDVHVVSYCVFVRELWPSPTHEANVNTWRGVIQNSF